MPATVGTPLLWGAFTLFVLCLLALDLGVFHRKAHAVEPREALGWGVFWIARAVVFHAGGGWGVGAAGGAPCSEARRGGASGADPAAPPRPPRRAGGLYLPGRAVLRPRRRPPHGDAATARAGGGRGNRHRLCHRLDPGHLRRDRGPVYRLHIEYLRHPGPARALLPARRGADPVPVPQDRVGAGAGLRGDEDADQ